MHTEYLTINMLHTLSSALSGQRIKGSCAPLQPAFLGSLLAGRALHSRQLPRLCYSYLLGLSAQVP